MKPIKEYQKDKIKLGKVLFNINKMPAYAGFELLEEVRVELAKTANITNPTGSVNSDIIYMIGLLSTDFSKYLRIELFKYVTFQREGDSAIPILSEEMFDMAFDIANDILPADIYELMLRCFVVNFFSSFKKIEIQIKKIAPSLSGE